MPPQFPTPTFVHPFALPLRPLRPQHSASPDVCCVPRRPRTRPICAKLGPPGQPDFVKRLDQVEKRRRDEHTDPPDEPLPPDDEEALFERIPELRSLKSQLDDLMAVQDYDPDDPNINSWAYNYLMPWRPSVILQVLALVAAYYLARFSVRRLIATYPLSTLLTALVAVDSLLTLTLAVIFPALFTASLLLRRRHKAAVDTVTRIMCMFTLSTFSLAPVAAFAATGNTALALSSGIAVRVFMLGTSLWYWTDLHDQTILSRTVPARLIRPWRSIVSYAVLIPGSILRLVALSGVDQLARALVAPALFIRRKLGARFPTAFSLCNDPRGLFFLASILIAISCIYLLFIAVFSLNLFQKRDHRRVETPLSQWLIQMGVFQPDVHPQQKLDRLSAEDKQGSYVPSPTMLLKHGDGTLDADSSYMVTETAMPIFAMLDNEDEMLEREGATEWIKPRFEQVPVTEDYSEEDRSVDALLAWAKPLDESLRDLTFEEFFQTIDENEYGYDANSGDWVFKNAAKALGADEEEGEPQEVEVSEEDTSKLMEALTNMNDGTPTNFAVPSSDMQPFLKKFLEDTEESIRREEGNDADEEEDNGTAVYV